MVYVGAMTAIGVGAATTNDLTYTSHPTLHQIKSSFTVPRNKHEPSIFHDRVAGMIWYSTTSFMEY
jgi:hypothetical protein